MLALIEIPLVSFMTFFYNKMLIQRKDMIKPKSDKEKKNIHYIYYKLHFHKSFTTNDIRVDP